MATATAKATYTKLKDESWGIRVQGTVAAGDTVTVAKRDGSTKQEVVLAVLWTGEGVSLCSIRRDSAPARGSSYSPRAGKPRRSYGDCDDFCHGCRRCM